MDGLSALAGYGESLKELESSGNAQYLLFEEVIAVTFHPPRLLGRPFGILRGDSLSPGMLGTPKGQVEACFQ